MDRHSQQSPLDAFIQKLTYAELSPAMRQMAQRSLLDTLAAGAAGLETPLSEIIRKHAVATFNAGEGQPRARLLFDGRSASPAGAALAGGMTIDAFDSHDGHVLTKGHAGAAVVPGLLALADAAPQPVSGPDFLTALVIGYEVAIRAGIAQHKTAPDYHTSGAWNALGVVAMAARLWGLSQDQCRHALGIAEYHGPRSQMMRCIDHPTMVKDGSGWGAMVGLSAAGLAADGFTGAPALVVEDRSVAGLWDDLGTHWRMLEMYFKPYPVCRWAQPAIEAALSLRQAYSVDPKDIEAVEIETFHEAVRLNHPRPTTTEQAQYSITFPTAVAIARGRLLPSDISGSALTADDILTISNRVRLVEAPALNARFPAERLARARFTLKDGRVLESDTLPARGDAERPLSDDEILEKYRAVTEGPLGAATSAKLLAAVDALPRSDDTRLLLDLALERPSAKLDAAANS